MATHEKRSTEPLQAVLRDEAERLRHREGSVHSETERQDLSSRMLDLQAAEKAMEEGQRLQSTKKRPRPGEDVTLPQV